MFKLKVLSLVLFLTVLVGSAQADGGQGTESSTKHVQKKSVRLSLLHHDATGALLISMVPKNLSHYELSILDEEGKEVYRHTFDGLSGQNVRLNDFSKNGVFTVIVKDSVGEYHRSMVVL